MKATGSPARYTSKDACQLAGVTYRRADYWCRTGVLTQLDGEGSGNYRTWTATDIAMLRVIGALADMGCQVPQLQRVAHVLAHYPLVSWGGRLWVTLDGQVHLGELHRQVRGALMVDLDAAVADLPVG